MFEYLMLLVVAIVAVATVVMYFRGRRINLVLMRDFARSMEELFRPSDKEYVLLGYLVGYKAEFKVMKWNISDITWMLTLLPRQSLLYYPISKLTSKFDRLYISAHLVFGPKATVHLISGDFYRKVIHQIKEAPYLSHVTTTIGGKIFHVLYDDARFRDEVLSIIDRYLSSGLKYLKHLAVNREYRNVYIFSEAKLEILSSIADFIKALASSLVPRGE